MSDDKKINFIKSFEIGKNQKDIYYQNVEQMTKTYYSIILIGIVFVLYIFIY